MSSSHIISFYLGYNIVLNYNNTTISLNLKKIWNYNFEQLNYIPYYIQWLFPLSDKSRYNKNAPTLTPNDIKEFRNSKHAYILQSNVLKSFVIMLHFYGFSYKKHGTTTVITCNKKTFLNRSKVWLTYNNQHYLRITRILKSLIELGLYNESVAFYQCLANTVYPLYSTYIGSKTLNIWRNTIQNNKNKSNKSVTSPLLNFYSKKGTDQSGRYITDIWHFSLYELEDVHNYIQWLFPTSQKSRYNKYPGPLTHHERAQFSQGYEYQNNLLISLEVMLKFYGLVMKRNNNSINITCNQNTFKKRAKVWINKDNPHNFDRFSRILRSLTELGMKKVSDALLKCLLKEIYPNPLYHNIIGNSIHYWIQNNNTI